jgi:hypothetical protein
MIIKIQFLLLFSLNLIVQTLYGQNLSTVTDTIAKLFADDVADRQIMVVKSDTDYQPISARCYFLNSKIIQKEYIRINKKTYRYWENDSLSNNRLIAHGDLIGNPHLLESESDTILEINPVTYENRFVVFKYFALQKEGK